MVLWDALLEEKVFEIRTNHRSQPLFEKAVLQPVGKSRFWKIRVCELIL